jgi:hypothetical protein
MTTLKRQSESGYDSANKVWYIYQYAATECLLTLPACLVLHTMSAYFVFRLQIRSLGYQELSSGDVSFLTRPHQRGLRKLDQAQ